MKYAIETLEIEIARVKMAYRKADEILVRYEDTQEGYPPNFQSMQQAIRQMEKAIEVLKEYQQSQPKPQMETY